LALLDDIPIMTIAYDNTYLSPTPVRWEMGRVLSVSTMRGVLATIESCLLFFLGRTYPNLALPELQTLLFLRLAAGGHLLLFVTRTRKSFFKRPFPSWQLLTAIVSTQIVAVLMCGFGWLVPALPWHLIGYVWIYIIIWMIIQDIFKLAMHTLMESRAWHNRRFLRMVNRPLHSHPMR
ncbi:MAG: hypothetical protein PHU44_06725, partial [Syntrophales bacterium]|nr:hypothetical protein [Syntrophales bacterium]